MRYIFLITSLFAAWSMSGQELERRGFVIGLGLGAGMIDIQDHGTETAFAATPGVLSLPNLKIGFMLSERTALLATFPGAIYEYEGRDRSFEAFLPTIQHWVGKRWWINGGAGLAMDFPAFYDMKGLEDPQVHVGYALVAAAGFELVQGRRFALDVQTRVQYGRVNLGDSAYREGCVATVGLGVNWY